jgi:replicative DNA helicase
MEVKQQQDSNKLSPTFVVELCKACLADTKVVDVCMQHLKYHYLENDSQKQVFKYILDLYETTESLPTLGVIAQNFSANKDVLSFLSEVKNIKVNKEDGELLLNQLEVFIKHSRFIEIFNTTHDLYQEGKREDAIKFMSEESLLVEVFSIKQKYYTTVFKDYGEREQKRMVQAKAQKDSRGKIPTGIRELDEIIYGGWRRKTSALILGQSGQGKSTALRWFGIAAARTGHIVVHFQIEGSESECLEGYDAAWTATKLTDFDSQEYGDIDEKTRRLVEKARRDITTQFKGEIIVYATESFDAMTIEKSREVLSDVIDIYGRVDLIIYDYLEVLETAKQYKDERKRREKIANNITNIAIEFDAASVTATQANDINPKDLINPDFTMSRHHISEFKGCLKPFSYFLTLNATPEESRDNIMRIHCDKFRRYPSGQTIMIAQKKDIGRFYESERTLNSFYKDRHK